MKAKLGIVLIVLGCGLFAAALALFFHNQKEQLDAADASRVAIEKVVEVIREQNAAESASESTESIEPTAPIALEDQEMTVVDIDGHGYIGFLGLPALELELPVLADWTYPKLQIAPCRYFGSIFTNNLVIMAHNYNSHFGRIRDMQQGDTVTFTDMDGRTVEYQVVALEVLGSKAVEDVVSGAYDLTLLTCTYGGENRVVLRCDRLQG